MIGRDLRAVREGLNITMGDLADRAKWHTSLVSDLERGARPVDALDVETYIATLARLVRARTPVAVIDAPR